jgi:hypothetical protein
MKSDEELTARTIKIIERGGRILLRRKDGYYLHCWVNIAAGPDHVIWGLQNQALEFFNLKWALMIAPLYGAKVTIVFTKKKS